jgi:hypothetical protein
MTLAIAPLVEFENGVCRVSRILSNANPAHLPCG